MISTKIEKICMDHRQPQIFICMVCQNTPLFCVDCIHSAHSSHSTHVKDVYSMDRLFRWFSQLVQKSVNQQLIQKQEVSVPKLIREKRQQVDQLYNELAQIINNKLMDERKKLHRHLDDLQNQLQQTKNSLHYLIPYAQDQQLLQIKIKTSSLEAITNLKKSINILKQKFTNQPNSFKTRKQQAIKKINQHFQKSFLLEFKKFIIQNIVEKKSIFLPPKSRPPSAPKNQQNSRSQNRTYSLSQKTNASPKR